MLEKILRTFFKKTYKTENEKFNRTNNSILRKREIQKKSLISSDLHEYFKNLKGLNVDERNEVFLSREYLK